MANTVEKVIDIALEEVGYIEKRSNKDLDSKLGNGGSANFTKYARDLDNIEGFYNGKKNGYAWCDVFVDWCFVQAFGVAAAKKLLLQPDKSYGAGCTSSMHYYKAKGQFYTSMPKVGDQIFFGNNANDAFHTGLVYAVDANYVYTVEGNTSSASGVVDNGGCVCKKCYYLTYNKILGYGRPKYDFETKTTAQLVEEVIDGKWGTGAQRKKALEAAGYNYEIIQASVNAKLTYKKSIEQLADEVLDGKWGNGSARKKKLEAAGYDYTAVQKAVNERLRNKKSVTEIAKEVIAGKWGNGEARKKKLEAADYDYDEVQAMVNKLSK